MLPKRTTRVATTLAALAVAASLAGCSGSGGQQSASADDWDDILAAAAEEGQVKMYVAWLPTAMEAVEADFEKAYPDIDLQLTRILPPEVDAALDTEIEAGQGPDIVSNTNYAWILNNLDRFAEPKGPDATAPEWADYTLKDKLQIANISALGISYNTDRVSAADVPKNYEDLLDPRYKGRIGIADNVAAPQADLYEWLEETYPGYWDGLKAQDPKFYATAVPIQEALLQGEIDVALWGSNALVQGAKADGAPLEWVLATPGWGPPNLTFILAESAHPNAAQVLSNWLATQDGQSAVAKNDITVLPDVPGTAGDASNLTVLDVERVAEPGWIDEQQSRWREAFGR